MRSLTVQAGRLDVVEAPDPEPGPGRVLVEVGMSAVNGMDVTVLGGGYRRQTERFRRVGPVVTGFEFAGTARSDGARIRSGQRVLGYSHVVTGPRTHAELVAMPERDLQVLPDSLDDAAAAALVVGALTGVHVVERVRPLSAGDRCLVIGASGGVGAYAVQLASALGAHVTAVAPSVDREWVAAQGAHEVRAGRSPDDWWRPDDRFDLVLDTPAASRFTEVAPHLSRHGTYVSTNPQRDLTGFARAAFTRRRAGWLMLLRSDPAGLQRMVDLAVAGTLRPLVDSIHRLDDAEDAFARVAGRGKRGRVLLRLREP
jgi:NADPH:quinone reductase